MSEFLVDVHGLRTFRVSDDGQLLPIIALDDSWRDGVCIAACRRDAAHQAPVEGCRCGIYTFRSLSVLRAQYEQAEQLVAIVALEGQTLAGSRGWRSQAGRVLAIWVEPGALPEPLLATLAGHLPDVVFYDDVDAMVSAYPDLSLSTTAVPGIVRLRRPAQLLTVQLHRVPLYVLATAISAALFLLADHSPGGSWTGLANLQDYVGQNLPDLFFPVLIVGLWVRARRIRGKAAVYIAGLLRIIIPIGLGAAIAELASDRTLGTPPLFIGYLIVIGWLELWQFAYAAGRTDGPGGVIARQFLHVVRQLWRVLRPSRRHTGVNYCLRTRHPINAYPLVMPVHFETGPDR